jgi:hypothetical protein
MLECICVRKNSRENPFVCVSFSRQRLSDNTKCKLVFPTVHALLWDPHCTQLSPDRSDSLPPPHNASRDKPDNIVHAPRSSDGIQIPRRGASDKRITEGAAGGCDFMAQGWLTRPSFIFPTK